MEFLPIQIICILQYPKSRHQIFLSQSLFISYVSITSLHTYFKSEFDESNTTNVFVKVKLDFGWLRPNQSKFELVDESDKSTYAFLRGYCYTISNIINDAEPLMSQTRGRTHGSHHDVAGDRSGDVEWTHFDVLR